MGGEKRFLSTLLILMLGSPPHGRGKASGSSSCKAFARITPAWAGKSRVSSRYGHSGRDHPRMGGEKPGWPGYAYNDRGSPPHGRGKGLVICSLVRTPRITPAWAGKRRSLGAKAKQKRDHPRMGGEKLMPPRMGFWLKGSPPHGRGKVVIHCGCVFDVGITPAWAGKSISQTSTMKAAEDHPRMGGEKTKKIP